MKKIATFIVMTVTSAISILTFLVVLLRVDLIVELLHSKPVLLLIVLTLGAAAGFLVGVLITYHKLNTELNDKKLEVKKLQKDLYKAKKFIEEILPDALTIRKIQAAKSAEEAQNTSVKRAEEIFGEIADLSEQSTSDVESTDTADETL